MKSIVIFLLTILTLGTVNAQTIINGYAEVTAINGFELTISNVDETADTFDDGDQIIIMQMQDDVLGNTTNSENFGQIGGIGAAGQYETLTIQSRVGNSLSLLSTPENLYNICDNCTVQVITYPTLNDGSGNFSTTETLTAKSWDGFSGGVIAFEVSDTLFLQHNIDVNEKGFRGGDVNGTNLGGACQPNTYRTRDDTFALKGEGIHKITRNRFRRGRGKIINGGGGGNPHNSGGGGGGNYSAGGNSGDGFSCGSNDSHGFGGIDLSSYVEPNRIFMGGGGGGGQGNNSVAASGRNGGGLILIKARVISDARSSSTTLVTANGGNAISAGNDGSGGGGAGGSIVFEVGTWDFQPSSGVLLQVNGGNGGNVGSGAPHGGGGGGGIGVIVLSTSSSIPTALVTDATPGNGGFNSNDDPNDIAPAGASSPSDPAADIDGVIVTEIDTSLPVELISWEAEIEGDLAVLRWVTASELHNDFFTIEKSLDGQSWELLEQVQGNGTSNKVNRYTIRDNNLIEGSNYYRLTQTDFDGAIEVFPIIVLNHENTLNKVKIYPNPSNGQFNIAIESRSLFNYRKIQVINMDGKVVFRRENIDSQLISINLNGNPPGIYQLLIHKRDGIDTAKIVIK